MSQPLTAAHARRHYAADVASATDAQLAALILRRTTLGQSRLGTILGAMAEDEAQARGHDLPTFWALTVGL